MSRKTPLTKQRIERHLGRSVPDRIWSYVVKKNYVSEVSSELFEEGDPVEFVANEVRQLLDATEPIARENQLAGEFAPSRRRQRREKMLPLRREIVSELLAGIARRRPDVQSFRREVLRGRLLQHAEVAEWIKSLVGESHYRHALIVKLPKGVFPTLTRDSNWHLPKGALEGLPIENVAPVEMIDYSRPESPSVNRAPCGRDGVLYELKSISRDLARLCC